MIKQVFSVRDIVSDTYAAPFCSLNHGTALRDFSHACRDKSSALSQNPQDFQLYKIAEFDDTVGVLMPCSPQLVANATQFSEE